MEQHIAQQADHSVYGDLRREDILTLVEQVRGVIEQAIRLVRGSAAGPGVTTEVSTEDFQGLDDLILSVGSHLPGYAPGTTARHAAAALRDAILAFDAKASDTRGEPVAWSLLDQGMRAIDDFEDYERVVLASEIEPDELDRFRRAGRATPLFL